MRASRVKSMPTRPVMSAIEYSSPAAKRLLGEMVVEHAKEFDDARAIGFGDQRDLVELPSAPWPDANDGTSWRWAAGSIPSALPHLDQSLAERAAPEHRGSGCNSSK